MPEGRTFRCRVLTTEEAILDVEAVSVVFPAADGMVGVLTGRLPLVAALGAGRVIVRRPGRQYRVFVEGGAAHMRNNVLTILAEKAQRSGR
jgi:F0F1-type ATP synthase epsilon subunit